MTFCSFGGTPTSIPSYKALKNEDSIGCPNTRTSTLWPLDLLNIWWNENIFSCVSWFSHACDWIKYVDDSGPNCPWWGWYDSSKFIPMHSDNKRLSTCENQHYSMNHEICTLDGNPRRTHSSIVGSSFMIQSTCMLPVNQ
jgi:hypothetical protein